MIVGVDIVHALEESHPVGNSADARSALEGGLQRALSDEDESASHSSHRPDQILEPLVADQAPHGEDHSIAMPCAERADPLAVCMLESIGGYAERQHVASLPMARE